MYPIAAGDEAEHKVELRDGHISIGGIFLALFFSTCGSRDKQALSYPPPPDTKDASPTQLAALQQFQACSMDSDTKLDAPTIPYYHNAVVCVESFGRLGPGNEATHER